MTQDILSFTGCAANQVTVSQWDAAAEGWSRHGPLIRNWLRGATKAMLEMAHVQPGMRVLDVAAGAGDQTRDLVERVGASGSVVAVDISSAILRFVSDPSALAPVHTQVANAEALPFDEASFDAVVCRLGLMFLQDPGQGVREMARVLRPNGWACAMVFSRPDRNPCITTLIGTASRHAGQPPRDPFQPGGLLSLGRPGHMDELFRAAGFRDVATTALEAPFHLSSVDEYMSFIQDAAGPVRDMLSRLPASDAHTAWEEIRDKLRAFEDAEGWHGPNELLLTAARAGHPASR